MAQAHDGPALRRVISPSQPLWIIHIDTWNSPNPQAIINMVPEDIKPYVVFNLSLSATESICADGKKVVDSWMKVCAENRVWTMIQPASGGCSAFDDDDLELYESYYKNYPNFLGWNHSYAIFPEATGALHPSYEVCPSVWRLSLCKLYAGLLFCQYDASGIHEA